MAFLSVNNVSRYEGGKLVVNDLSFEQQPLQKIAIAGETGSGKTSLLKMIAGLSEPAAGKIYFDDEKVLGPNEQLIAGHKGIAYMSQYFELRNNYFVNELLEMANQLANDEAGKIFEVCQVEHLRNRKTNQLSGGEKQRIALARLLITSPKLLLLDEPFSNLDALHKSAVKSVIHDIGEKLGITCILVSHDALDVLSWADKIIVLKDGSIIQQGTAAEIYEQPVNEYCAGLFGDYNLLNDFNKKIVTEKLQLHTNSKTLLIRPEKLQLVEEEEALFSGYGQQLLFWGSYYTMDVKINNQLLRVRTNNPHYRQKEKIFLSVLPSSLIFVE